MVAIPLKRKNLLEVFISLAGVLSWSGRLDSNQRPLDPQSLKLKKPQLTGTTAAT